MTTTPPAAQLSDPAATGLGARLLWSLAVVVFAATVYCLGLERMPLEGEESRRGCLSREMAASGDWVVPTQQGEPFVDRPPLQYWYVSTLFRLTGDSSITTLRLSAALATVATVLLILWSAAPLAGWPAAAFGATAYASMALVLDLGARAETESVFTLLLSGAFLAWLGVVLRGGPMWVAWVIGYSLAALATLAKGTQAPVAFGGATVLWFVLQRRWKEVFSVAHATGLAAYAIILTLWLAPLLDRLSLVALREAFVEPGRQRFDAPALQFLKHWTLYPFEVLIGMLPWAPLLLGIRSVLRRPADDNARSAALFLMLAMLVMLFPLWLAPWARGRYYLPAFPLVGVLLALIVGRGGVGEWPEGPFQLFRGYATTIAFLFVPGAVILLGIPFVRDELAARLSAKELPRWPVWAGVAIGIGVGALLLRQVATARNEMAERRRLLLAFGVLACVTALLHRAIVVPILAGPARDLSAAVAEARSALPRGTALVSIGPINHRFAYYWSDPIGLVSAEPQDAAAADIAPGAYFCVNHDRGTELDLPFSWQQVASVGMDVYSDDSEQRVLIARRLSAAADAEKP